MGPSLGRHCLHRLPPATLQAAYQKAHEWLAGSQSQDVVTRLNKAGRKLASNAQEELTSDEATEVLLTKPGDLQDRMLKYEGAIIKQALAQANGLVSHAAPLLGMTYQGLAYIIKTRHPDLLKKRSPVRRRKRKSLQGVSRHNP